MTGPSPCSQPKKKKKATTTTTTTTATPETAQESHTVGHGEGRGVAVHARADVETADSVTSEAGGGMLITGFRQSAVGGRETTEDKKVRRWPNKVVAVAGWASSRSAAAVAAAAWKLNFRRKPSGSPVVGRPGFCV